MTYLATARILRGGVRVFYERVQGNDIYDADINPPFSYIPKASNVRFSSPTTSWTGAVTPPTALPSAPAAVNSIANYYPNPATAQFSLGIQRELAPSVVFVLQYVGTSGWNQNNRVEQNDLPLANIANRQAIAQGGNANLYRPFLGFSNILQSSNVVNSNYNSLQTAVRMEKRHGLSLQLAYTGRTESTHKMAVRIFKLPQIPTTSATIVVPGRLTAATSSTQTTFTTFHSSTTPVALLNAHFLGVGRYPESPSPRPDRRCWVVGRA